MSETNSYYVADGDQRKGPFSLVELRPLGLSPQTLVWRQGMADWQPAGGVAELAAMFSAPAEPREEAFSPLPPGAPSPAAPPLGYTMPTPGGYNQSEVNSKKILCGVLGIMIGALGVHKFVLNYTGTGILMLCLSLGLAVVTCGILAPFSLGVMGIIGMVEGIIYLTKSDEEFYRLYILGRRPWF